MTLAIVFFLHFIYSYDYPVHSTSNVVSSNPTQARCACMYSKQQYVIKFVSDLRQVGGFLRVPRCPPINKTDHHDITEIFLIVALNTITLTLTLTPFTSKFLNNRKLIPCYVFFNMSYSL
jgi:hypothetical protein